MCLLRGTDWSFIYRQFNIQQFYVLPTQCIYVFCVDLRTNGDYFPVQHWLTGFYNRDGECLLRGTDWIFIYRQFNIQQFYVLPTQCIYVFCVDLRTDSDYFPVQHWLTGFYNRDGECLLRGTDWIIKKSSYSYYASSLSD